MATVHPSRMGLVPQDSYYADRRRARSRSRSPRNRDSTRLERDGRGDGQEGNRDRAGGRERSSDRRPRSSSRQRDHSASRSRDRERDGRNYQDRRRPSPEYLDYRRPASPGPAAPWKQQENMYPNRGHRDRPPHGYGGGGADYMDSRRLQRENSSASIWPPSPKEPVRPLSTERGSSRRKSKRDRSETPTDSDTDSEYERRRRERKERRRQKKKERKEKREKRERKRRRSRSYDDDAEESDSRGRKRRSQSESQPRSPSRSRTPSTPARSEEDDWVEKPVAAPIIATSQPKNLMPPPSIVPSRKDGPLMSASSNLDPNMNDYDDSDEETGPQPAVKINTKVDERAYGGALLRGEGSAMAAFLQDSTDTRIPRRGEIGLTSDEIAAYEAVGYVMSGSRHKRMNAVRMRKENQVISAEEKRGILKLQKEERARREAILREEFSDLVQEKLSTPEVRRG
ncbi:ras-induced vulval development antagonist-domain-containing protein [Scleroderma citrinum]